MSFLPAVHRAIAAHNSPSDPVGEALKYLLNSAVGHGNAVPLEKVVAHLVSIGISMSPTDFQQTVLAESRNSDFFIGSGPRGYFLINSIDDARAMKEFYEARITAEKRNLDNLERQSRLVGWNL